MTDAVPTSTRQRPGGRSARVRAAVLDGVIAELVEVGYDGLTVDGVARRAGVHRTSVYRRWRDVGGLLVDALQAAAEDDWAPPDTGSLIGDLVRINREVHAYLSEPCSVSAAMIAASFHSAQAARALHAFLDDRFDRCTVVTERAVRRGEVDDGIDTRRLLIAATAPIYHHTILLREELTDDQVVAYAHDAALTARAGGYR